MLDVLEIYIPAIHGIVAGINCDPCGRRINDTECICIPLRDAAEDFFDDDVVLSNTFAPADCVVLKLTIEQNWDCVMAFDESENGCDSMDESDFALFHDVCRSGCVKGNECCCSCLVSARSISKNSFLAVLVSAFNDDTRFVDLAELKPTTNIFLGLENFCGTTIYLCFDSTFGPNHYDNFLSKCMAVCNQMAVENCLPNALLCMRVLKHTSTAFRPSCLADSLASSKTQISAKSAFPTIAPTVSPTAFTEKPTSGVASAPSAPLATVQ